jgi:guanylate kinase
MIAAETLYNGHKYWTIQYQFKDYYDNESPLLYVVDGEGVKSLRQTFPSEDVIGIYIDVSLGEMVSRMILRGDNQKNIDSRKRYFEDVVHKDKEVCQYVVDNNDDIVYAVNEVYKIIIKEIF